MIRVLIAHPTQAASSVFAQTLSQESDLRIVYQVNTAHEALARIGNDNCHIVLAAASLPDDGAMTLVRKLKASESGVRVIVTGMTDDKKEILRYISAGASGYTLQADGVSMLVETVRGVYQEKAFISQEIAAALMVYLAKLSTITSRTLANTATTADLTSRENEVLTLMAAGCSNQEIAERLVIGIGTVKNHVHSVLKKLNLRSRKETAIYLSHVQQTERYVPDANF